CNSCPECDTDQEISRDLRARTHALQPKNAGHVGLQPRVSPNPLLPRLSKRAAHGRSIHCRLEARSLPVLALDNGPPSSSGLVFQRSTISDRVFLSKSLLCISTTHARHEAYSCLPTFPEWTIHPPISEDKMA